MNIRILNLIPVLLLCAVELTAQGSRIKLTQLEQGQVVEGTRAGQIGLTNAAGDQRYAQYVEIQVDTIDFIPTPTGNATNLSEFVFDTLGALWYIDWQGNAVEFAGSSTCDTDWLEISDNSCPDAITDSIYKQRYASVGARLIWPGAEFLVNDSSTAAILVVQGFRNARTAWYDGNVGTFSMYDHGGTSPVWYVPVNSNTVWKTTVGTPQTPLGSQVNHFGINTQDSTIQMFQYPRTRVDTQEVQNFLYTDPVGKVRSQSIDYLTDTLNFGVNIYNSNGNFPAGITRNANLDTLSELRFNYPLSGGLWDFAAITIISPSDSSGTDGGSVIINGGPESGSGNSYIAVVPTGINMAVPLGGEWLASMEDSDGNQQLKMTESEIWIEMNNYDNSDRGYIYLDTASRYRVIGMEADGDISEVGFYAGQGGGLYILQQTSLPNPGQILVAGVDQTFYFADRDTGSVNIYNSSGIIPDDVVRTIDIGETGANPTDLFFRYAATTKNAVIINGGSGDEASGEVQINGPSETNWILVEEGAINITEGNDLQLGDRNVDNDGGGFSYIPGTIRVGDVFDLNAYGLFVDLSGNNTKIQANPANYLTVSADGTDGGILGGWDNSQSIFIQSDDALTSISQSNENLNISSEGPVESWSYQYFGDTTGLARVRASGEGGDRIATMNLDQAATGKTAEAVLSAYDATAEITLNEIRIDTAGVGINTRGGPGNDKQVLQSNGDKSYWGNTLDASVGNGVLNADMLSYDPNENAWITVNANRRLAFFGSGTSTPSIGNTEIIITDTATTSTLNLNYVPGELDGASYSGTATTVRYIYNWGSGDCTIDTNKDWLFRLSGVGAGSTTVTLPTMKQAKLIWRAGSSEANSRFFVMISDLE